MFSFESNNPVGFQEKYIFDLKRYYRTFFSKYPNVFLGIENQLRFIRMREANPSAKLAFIYSSACLNAQALKELKQFCQQHKITPVDFDTEIRDMLKEEQDKRLYAIAKEEIQRTLQNKNGNLAAASDCVRLLVPVIERYGIYTDFDVECSWSQVDGDLAELRAPVLLNCEMTLTASNLPYLLDSMYISVNSDFLAFSIDGETMEGLSAEALVAVRSVQAEIIKNYTQKFIESNLMKDIFCNDFMKENSDKAFSVLSQFRETTPAEGKDHTIYDLRRFASTLQDEKLKFLLEITSVTCVSGGHNYLALYKQVYPYKFELASIVKLGKPVSMYLSLFQKSSLEFYDGITKYVKITNCMSQVSKPEKKPTAPSDLSWHPKGEIAQKKREEKITQAALHVQGIWKRKKNGVKYPQSTLMKPGVRGYLTPVFKH